MCPRTLWDFITTRYATSWGTCPRGGVRLASTLAVCASALVRTIAGDARVIAVRAVLVSGRGLLRARLIKDQEGSPNASKLVSLSDLHCERRSLADVSGLRCARVCVPWPLVSLRRSWRRSKRLLVLDRVVVRVERRHERQLRVRLGSGLFDLLRCVVQRHVRAGRPVHARRRCEQQRHVQQHELQRARGRELERQLQRRSAVRDRLHGAVQRRLSRRGVVLADVFGRRGADGDRDGSVPVNPR